MEEGVLHGGPSRNSIAQDECPIQLLQKKQSPWRLVLKDVVSMSLVSQMAFDVDLKERSKVKEPTFVIKISYIYPPVHDRKQKLPKNQVRDNEDFFLDDLKERMKQKDYFLTVLLVLFADPQMCLIKQDFEIAKIDTYMYYVLGGNHLACAMSHLTRVFPHNLTYKVCLAQIYAKA